MKSIVSDKSIEKKKITTFPTIGKLIDSTDGKVELVVLFYTRTTGTVLSTKNTSHKIGDYFTGWDIILFEPFEGSVTLKN